MCVSINGNNISIRVFNSLSDIDKLYRASCKFFGSHIAFEEFEDNAGKFILTEVLQGTEEVKIPSFISGYVDNVFGSFGNNPRIKRIVFPRPNDNVTETPNVHCCLISLHFSLPILFD